MFLPIVDLKICLVWNASIHGLRCGYDITKKSCRTTNSYESCESWLKTIVFDNIDVHSCFGTTCNNLKEASKLKLN
jgi:hypothetical protein